MILKLTWFVRETRVARGSELFSWYIKGIR